MKDVTDALLKYREATRHLWNSHFRASVSSPSTHGNLDRYEEIDKLLFISLVLDSIGRSDYEFNFRDDSYPFLHVLPNEGADALRLRLSDPLVGRGRSWNEPTNVAGASSAVLELIEFFEWDRYAWVSFPYYRVRVRSFPGQPHLENLEALVEVQTVRVCYIEKGISRSQN